MELRRAGLPMLRRVEPGQADQLRRNLCDGHNVRCAIATVGGRLRRWLSEKSLTGKGYGADSWKARSDSGTRLHGSMHDRCERDPGGCRWTREVTLVGARRGRSRSRWRRLADWCGGFHYEIPCCDLGKRVPRVYVRGGKIDREQRTILMIGMRALRM